MNINWKDEEPIESYVNLISKSNRAEKELEDKTGESNLSEKLLNRTKSKENKRSDRSNARIGYNKEKVDRKVSHKETADLPLNKPDLPKSFADLMDAAKSNKYEKWLNSKLDPEFNSLKSDDHKRISRKIARKEMPFHKEEKIIRDRLAGHEGRSKPLPLPKSMGAEEAGAIAAEAGMKKYGKKKFEEMAHKKHKKSDKPGGGGRFKKLKDKLENE